MIAFWTGRAISENQRLEPGPGRFRVNQEYQAFKESVAWILRREQLDKPPSPRPISVRLYMVLNPAVDSQNIIKPCLDALQIAGVIKNDRQVIDFHYYREDARKRQEDMIGIIVTEIG